MTPNILISRSEGELESLFAHDFIAHIDGEKTQTLRSFYEAVSDLLEAPDFVFTLDGMNDLLNDLQWLEDPRIILYFTNTTDLISKERDPAKFSSVLNVIDATAEDWKWVDEEDVDKKELIIVFEDSPRIRKALEQEHINYTLISDVS